MASLIVLQDCCTIQLTQGKNTLVDREIASRFANVSLYVQFVYGSKDDWYAMAASGKKTFHRMLMGEPPGILVDHRNGDKLDNRLGNLRMCDPNQNARNQRRIRGASRFKGVCREGKSWVARVRAGDNIIIRLGRFKSEVEAARCYDAGAKQYHGEFACTNEDLLGRYWVKRRAK